MERIVIPATTRHLEYALEYPNKLRRTDKSYKDSLRELPEGFRMSSAEEERALISEIEKTGQNLRDSKAFADLFRKKNGYRAWQWTSTGLRVPKGWENGRYQTNANGDREHPRIVLEGEEERDTILVPEGSERVVVEWHNNGIPKTTRSIAYPHKPYTTHFLFDVRKKEVAVGLAGYWLCTVPDWCLAFYADCERSDEGPDVAFRPVRTYLSEEERKEKIGRVSIVSGGELSLADGGRLSLT